PPWHGGAGHRRRPRLFCPPALRSVRLSPGPCTVRALPPAPCRGIRMTRPDPARRPAPAAPVDVAPGPELPASPPAIVLADEGEIIAPCPQCGAPMFAIRGSKLAVCRNCGFKDSCCY